MRLRVLIVEDSIHDAFLMVRELKQAFDEVNHLRVDDEESFERALDEQKWDVILSDYSLPQFTGKDALHILHSKQLDIPFIVVSGYIDEQAAVKMLKAGAHDYFSKDKMTLLVPAIEREIREAQVRQQNHYAEEALVESEARYRSLIENLPQSILVFVDDEIVFANPATLEMFGLTDRNQLTYDRIRDIVVPLLSQAPDNRFSGDETKHDSQSLEAIIKIPDGKEVVVEITSILIRFQGRDAIQVVLHDITAQKQAQEMLKAQQEFDRTTLNSLSAHIAIFDKDANIIATNQAWDDFGTLNGGRPRLNGHRINYLQVCESSYGIGDEETGKAASLIRDVLAGKRQWAQMETSCSSVEKERYYMMNIRPYGDIKYASAVVSFEDITAQKLAERELRSLYNATGSLFEGNNLEELSQYIVNAIVDEFNESDCGLMLVDKTDDAIVRLARSGQYRVETTVPLDLDGAGLVPEAVRTGEVTYAPDVTRDIRYLPNQSNTRSELVVPLKSGDAVIGVLDLQSPNIDAFGADRQRILMIFAERASRAIEVMQLYDQINQYATELEDRVAERTASLQQTTERIEAILNNSTDVIILADIDHNIRMANPAIESIFGYVPDDLIGCELCQLVVPELCDDLIASLDRVMQSGQNLRIQTTALRHDNIEFTADVALSLITHDDDTREVICSIRDISRQKELEQELRVALQKEQELNQLKSSFVAMVSHEYRTPLATILSSIEMLEYYDDRLSDDRKLHHLRKVGSQVKRMTDLMDDVLQLSKAKTEGLHPTWQKTDVRALVSDIVEDARQATDIHHISLKVAEESAHCIVDPNLIQLAVSNFISNAVKYSPDGGDIEVELSCQSGNLSINIRDNGIGIPLEAQTRLFEQFHRASNARTIQGTGLGLAIAKQAVEAHNGTIEFESEVDVGTTFTITIPQ